MRGGTEIRCEKDGRNEWMERGRRWRDDLRVWDFEDEGMSWRFSDEFPDQERRSSVDHEIHSFPGRVPFLSVLIHV